MFTKLRRLLRHFRRTALLACIFSAVSAYALQVATPTFSPVAGTYSSAQSVTINTTTSSATIRYTTDGSTPSETSGIIYSGPVSISSSTMLRAVAYESSFTTSAVISGLYSITSSPAAIVNVLYNFTGSNDGAAPYAGLIQGTDGNFYGTTYSDGINNQGTVFKLTPSGALTTLASFNVTNGATPSAGLIQGSDGNFYGTTYYGGSNNDGTVFQMTPAGVLTSLVSFNNTNGAHPYAGLVQGSDGNFYGMTYSGGSANDGTVFMITPAGVLTTLVSFGGANGSNPEAALVQGNDGNFYGTTYYGGSSYVSGSNLGYGTVFMITPSGVLTTLVSFNNTNGANPLAGLVQGSDGNFYGTTQFGGDCDCNAGTVFQVTPAGVLTSLVSFDSATGEEPLSGLIQGSDGNFYGTAYFGGASGINKGVAFQVIVQPAAAPTFSPGAGTYIGAQSVTISSLTSGATIRYTTDGSTPTEANGIIYSGPVSLVSTTLLKAIAYEPGLTNSPVTNGIYTIGSPAALLNIIDNFFGLGIGGKNPQSSLVQGNDGNFYGTTNDGGTRGAGTIFSTTPAGVLTTLVSFNNTNGQAPYAGLTLGIDGNFYGTTYSGGSANDGTVFKMTTAGDLTPLASFTGVSLNGQNPTTALVQGTDGNFYGTTLSGGANNDGTVFRMTPAGTLTNLLSFTGANGASPYAGLVQANDGNFYGTTLSGGANNDGTVFRMTPAGTLTNLVSFTGANGASPYGGLVEGTDSNFYGTTLSGGADNDGTVFRMTPAGALSTLVSFTGANGKNPNAGLVQGSDGNFYGTTGGSTVGNDGTVFMMTPAGVLTTLVLFDGANGENPYANLVQGTDGNFYGTTYDGGIWGGGTIFQLIRPLPLMAAPAFSPAAGTYTSAQTVSMTSATSGASIRYTTDGSAPTEINGTLYSTPVSISSTTTLKAVAYESGFTDSTVTSGTYTINDPPSTPTPAAGGGGGAFDDWFLGFLAFAGVVRWRIGALKRANHKRQ